MTHHISPSQTNLVWSCLFSTNSVKKRFAAHFQTLLHTHPCCFSAQSSFKKQLPSWKPSYWKEPIKKEVTLTGQLYRNQRGRDSLKTVRWPQVTWQRFGLQLYIQVTSPSWLQFFYLLEASEEVVNMVVVVLPHRLFRKKKPANVPTLQTARRIVSKQVWLMSPYRGSISKGKWSSVFQTLHTPLCKM